MDKYLMFIAGGMSSEYQYGLESEEIGNPGTMDVKAQMFSSSSSDLCPQLPSS